MKNAVNKCCCQQSNFPICEDESRNNRGHSTKCVGLFLWNIIVFFMVSVLPGNVLAQGRTSDTRQTKTIFDLLDTNHDGKITLSEFKNNQMLIFYIWDKNKDMILTPNETPLPKDVFNRIAGENSRIDTMEFMNVVDSAFEQADENRDGILDLAEFTKMRLLVRRK